VRQIESRKRPETIGPLRLGTAPGNACGNAIIGNAPGNASANASGKYLKQKLKAFRF
jgi:hypothetical protein